MSHIVAVAVHNVGVYIIGDKRAIKITDGKYSGYDDNIKKIYSLTNATLIGYSGSIESIAKVTTFINKKLQRIYFPDDFVNFIAMEFYDRSNIFNNDVEILITGISSIGMLSIYKLTDSTNFVASGNSRLSTNRNNPIIWNFVGVYNAEDPNFFKSLTSSLTSIDLTQPIEDIDKEVISIVTSHIHRIASECDVVSKNIDIACIHCKDSPHWFDWDSKNL